MKTSKQSSRPKAGAKAGRTAAKAKKPAASKVKTAKAAKSAKPAAAKGSRAPTAATAKSARAPAKPVHEWAEAIKKAALQNKQGSNAWPGAGSPSWKGKQRPE